MAIKLPIWGDSVPHNTGQSKFDELELKNKHPSEALSGLKALAVLKKDEYNSKRRHWIHEATYAAEIRHGEGRETYDDQPTLTPYMAPGSDRAIIVVPGGGYMTKDIKHEGEGVARSLNEAGISAFVLDYRLNPYKAPIPMLDMQRAVRYVRYHAPGYGIDPAKIGAVGFSAGGHLVSSLITLRRGLPVEYAGYEADSIDRTDDSLALAGLIYPLISCTDLPSIAISMFSREDAEDPAERERLLKHYSLAQHVRPGDPPQFLCYGDHDHLLGSEGVQAYQRALDAHGVPNRMLAIEGADHGFGDCERGTFVDKVLGLTSYAYWKKEFTDWANAKFDQIRLYPSTQEPECKPTGYSPGGEDRHA
ncbi:alpha/beta hydrolase [Saccharibacillus brassicae]|uniref:Alpha/beta hydrolase n=1 Tax=Saccharibacillus brassicae TaxID=2583377 RepID=A0A4Y6V1J2_SACBS|nr:alpha/beta hydrolase [Saccharibacillus brassicae]QDH23224.1 alpha/beta hydrolase [Saccharibacillus brassicae]